MGDMTEDRLFKCLADMEGSSNKITASDIAKQFGVSRNLASHYLNRLLDQKLVLKYGTKPVYWKTAAICEEAAKEIPGDSSGLDTGLNPGGEGITPFDLLIGSKTSLRRVVEQCTAAVNYPPLGLPVIISGPSGAGKSYLARLVYEYAREMKIIAEAAPFIMLNCADYANNPELLSATLFGYTKGAFTGAYSDRDGMLAEANNGFFFLDEVHRLSYENQEKLFVLMDQGHYRRLGENKTWLKASVRFIFATTENIDTVLLETFRRRIPVKIRLSKYSQRPFYERLQFIRLFYWNEAKAVDKDIVIDPAVLTHLAGSQMGGNVGSLQNLIRLTCAHAFDHQKESAALYISFQDMPEMEHCRSSADELVFDQPLEVKRSYRHDYITEFAAEYLAVKSPVGEFYRLAQEFCSGEDFDKLYDKYLACCHMNEAEGETASDFRQYLADIIKKCLSGYGITFTDSNLRTFALFYEYARNMAYLDTEQNEQRFARFLKYAHQKYPRGRYIIGVLFVKLGDVIPENELNYYLKTAMYFMLISKVNENLLLHGLIVAHGDGIASGMAKTANNILSDFIFEGIDMPIHVSISGITEKVKQFIQKAEIHQGCVILVDMGSLSELYEMIKDYYKGELLIISNLTSLMAIDVGCLIARQATIQEIAEKANGGYSSKVKFYKGRKTIKKVVVSCISGIGIAEKIKDIILEHIDNDSLQITAMDYRSVKKELKQEISEALRDVQLIITTSELPESKNIPILNLTSSWNEAGEQILWKGLNRGITLHGFEILKEEINKFFSIEGVSSKLNFLNPHKVINDVEKVLVGYERYYGIRMENRKRLNLYLHISVMVERLMTMKDSGEIMEAAYDTGSQEKEFYRISKEIFEGICGKYRIELNEYELHLLYELFSIY